MALVVTVYVQVLHAEYSVLMFTGTDSTFVASPATCGACQCALVTAVAPLLQDSGAILPTEMYTANAVISITSTLMNCSREFAVQLLEGDPSLKLSQLLSLDACVPDEKITSQCMSQPSPAAANSTGSNATAFGNPSDGSNTLNEIIRDASCALAGKAHRCR